MYAHALGQTDKSAYVRIDWVDYAKGFCILFVVMMHSTLGVEKHAVLKGLAADGATGWMNWVVTFAQPFRMPDFFLISGLFLGLVIGRSLLQYLDRKVVHFFYFYVLWLAIQFAVRSFGWIGEGLGPDEILAKFAGAFLQPYGTLWFIYILPVMFVITRFLVWMPWYVILIGAALLEIAPVHTGWLIIDEFASRYVYFFAGFSLAKPIFALARLARANARSAVICLVIWAVINGIMTLSAPPHAVAEIYRLLDYEVPANLAQLPFVSLALGTAGAVAVVSLCAILSRFRFAGFLRYLGMHSIVVYLAFFLPMIVSREVLMRFAPWLDLGSMSLIVLLAGVTGPVILYEFTHKTGWLTFLFKRPKWISIDKSHSKQDFKASRLPAE